MSYAIIGAVSGTGNLWPPFLRALGRIMRWNVLPNGKRATFYDLWAGHTTQKARYRSHIEEDLGQVSELVRNGTINANIAARFPLTDIVQTLTLAESRNLNGKIGLLP